MISINDELHIPGIGLWLDARRPRRLSFISHAHSDHMGRHAKTIASRATAALCRLRLSNSAETAYEVRDFGEWFEHAGVMLQLVPAGHVLGSSQIVVRADDITVYTGDFKLRNGRTHELCQVPSCDTLIMECTYGRPHYRFPDRSQVESELIGACRGALAQGLTPVIYAYALGKSQEIIAALNWAGLAVMAHGAVANVCDAYASLGIELGRYERYQRHALDGHVLVTPPETRRARMIHGIARRFEIAVTGWAVDRSTCFRLGVDLALPFSDHADFGELLRYVEQAAPKRVFCVHGFPDFVRYLRRAGVNARWLAPNEQLELFL